MASNKNSKIDKKFLNELISKLKKKKYSKGDIARLKIKLCKKYKIPIPKDIDILINADEDDRLLLSHLKTKPVRTISGVAICAIMAKPLSCPHGKCITCPGGPDSFFGNVPQSYTGKEPAARRAIRNNFDPYLQVMNRLEQYIMTGHVPNKIELIIMGGTFPSYPWTYQQNFVRDAFKAMNDFSKLFFSKGKLDIKSFREFFEMPGDINDKGRIRRIHTKLIKIKKSRKTSLEKEQLKNESAFVRCVGMTIETRPDYCMLKHANRMLKLGATRVELGVQTIYDDVLNRINRGHTVMDSINATGVLKDLGFKVAFHMMLGLPGSNNKRDINAFKELFANPNFRPDMLKIYPCMVLPGTKLYEMYEAGHYLPISTQNAVKLIREIKKIIPPYVRIMRVQRDIPSSVIVDGVDRTNLRQYVYEYMKKHGESCRCIRCREIGHKMRTDNVTFLKKNVALSVIGYEASNSTEYFISLIDQKNDAIVGYCRLRFPSKSLRKEITKHSALIRELHVLGESMPIGVKGKIQHAGYGKKLLKTAEKLAKEGEKNKLVVISGVGVREYYRKLGYRREGPYMVKWLSR